MYLIKQYREAKGMSQLDLAKQLHVDRSTVCSWELGRINPSLPMAIRLADALTDGSIDRLMGRDTA